MHSVGTLLYGHTHTVDNSEGQQIINLLIGTQLVDKYKKSV